jgi:hypothetical protein
MATVGREPSRLRRLAASASLVATGGGIVAIAVREVGWRFLEWPVLAAAALVAAAGVGLSRRSLVVQALSRGTAWLVLAPMLVIIGFAALSGRWPEAEAVLLAGGSGSALLLARPMLHTKDAHERFAPAAYRRLFLAGSTAAAMGGLVSGMLSFEALRYGHHYGTAFGLGALALALLGATIGTVKMRAWGVLLGAATTIATLVAALVQHDASSLALGMAAVPGLLLAAPLLLSRVGKGREQVAEASPRVRVAADVASETTVRVADAPRDMRDLHDTHEEALPPKPALAARV